MQRARVSLLALCVMTGGAVAASAAPTLLSVPQSAALSVLGHSCGGIQEPGFVPGLAPSTGFPTANGYRSSRCGGSGRGGGYHPTTYAAWVSASWDLTGAFVSHAVLAAAPTVDPTFTAFDAFGNEVYDQSNSAFLLLAP